MRVKSTFRKTGTVGMGSVAGQSESPGRGTVHKKDSKETISGDGRLRSGLLDLKVRSKSRHRWEPVLSLYLFFIVLDIEAKASHLLGKWSTSAVHPLPLFLFLTDFYHRCLALQS